MTYSTDGLGLAVLSTGRENCSNRHSWGPGAREFYILHYVVAGRGTFEQDGIRHNLSAGQSFLIYPHLPVVYYPAPDDPWEYIWVDFTGSEAGLILGQTAFTPHHPVAPAMDPWEMIPLLEQIRRSEGPFSYNRCRCTGGLYTLLSRYLECFPADPTADSGLAHVRAALDYIAAHYYRSSLSVPEVAEHTGISCTHLYRLFRRHLSRSPNEYLLNIRIENACNLLRGTSLPVQTIAYSVGFNNPLYFSKAFRQRIGMSPSEYRRRPQEEK